MKAMVATHCGSPDVLQLTAVEIPAPRDDAVLMTRRQTMLDAPATNAQWINRGVLARDSGARRSLLPREPGVAVAERGPSAAASRSEGSYDAPHQPVSQVRVAVSHPADQGEYAGVITAPAPAHRVCSRSTRRPVMRRPATPLAGSASTLTIHRGKQCASRLIGSTVQRTRHCRSEPCIPRLT